MYEPIKTSISWPYCQIKKGQIKENIFNYFTEKGVIIIGDFVFFFFFLSLCREMIKTSTRVKIQNNL